MPHYLSFDAETHLITQQTGPIPTPVCWSFYSPTQQDLPMLLSERFNGDQVSQIIHEALNDEDTHLIGQNVNFDLLLLWRYHDIPLYLILDKMRKGHVHDTSVREKLIHIATYHPQHPERRTGLDTLVKRYLHLDITEDKKDPNAWRLRYAELTDVPVTEYPKKAFDYAYNDALYTYEVFAAQTNYAECFTDAPFQLMADLALKLMSAHAPKVDQQQVEVFRESQQMLYDEVKELLIESGLLRFNKNRYAKDFPKDDPRRGGYSVNTKELKTRIEADCLRQGIEPVRSLKTKAISASGEALEQVEDPLVQAYAKVQNARKLLDTFIPALKKAGDNRVMPYYDCLKVTGRVGCANFPLQQMPRAEGARECCVPSKKGNVLVCADYDSFELAALAQVAYEDFQLTTLKDSIDEGKDPHCMTGAILAGEQYEEFLKKYKAGRHYQKDLRQASKALNFGIPGGMGVKTLIKSLSPDQREGLKKLFPEETLELIVSRMIQQWKEGWNLWPYFERVAAATRHDRVWTYVHPFTGRKRGGLGYSNGLNVQFQGRCADAAKVAMVLIMEDCYFPEGVLRAHGVTCSGFMHDEFMFEGPTQYLTEWTERVEELMVSGAAVVIPDVTIRAGVQVMDRWQKEGQSVEDYLNGTEDSGTVGHPSVVRESGGQL